MTSVAERAEHVLQTYFRSEIERINQDIPPFLFHYTSVAGLQGILGSGCFWVNAVEHLNDLAELRITASIVRAHIERFHATERNDEVRPLYEAMRSIMNKIDFSDVFIFSLVADGDDIDLWRLYGDRGSGFSLTFSVATPFEWNENLVLVKCVYGEDAVHDFSRRAIQLVRTIYRQDLSDGVALPATKYADMLFEEVRWFAPIFKLKVWEDEKEWRLFRIGSGGDRLQRPDGRYYIKAPTKGRATIVAACCGPTCPPSAVMAATKAAYLGGYKHLSPFHSSAHTAKAHREAVDEFIRNYKP